MNASRASAAIRDRLRRHGYAVAVVAVVGATALFVPFRDLLGREQWGWPYLLVLGFVAGTAGVGPAVLSALLAFFAWNFFFIPPYHTLFVAERGDVVHLGVFLVVSVAVGLQTGRLRDREVVAQREERHAAALNRLSGSLVSETSAQGLADAAAEELAAVADARGARLWIPNADRDLTAVSGDEEGSIGVPDDVAEFWAAVSRDTDVYSDVVFDADVTTEGDGGPLYRLLVPLVSADTAEGMLEIRLTRPPGEARRDFIMSAAHLLAAFLQSRRLDALAMHAAASREAERLRSAVVSSVSHELKTPLAAITAAVTDLLEPDVERAPGAVQDKLRDVADDLKRLDEAIADLLDVSRLEAQAWEPRPVDFEVGELVGDVVSRLSRPSRERVRYAIPEDLPMLHLDFTQLSRALHHLVDNALEYSEGPVTIGARADQALVLWVEDSGPGIPESEKSAVFDKFFRGRSGRASHSSTGLGLAIAREIIRANQGDIGIEDAHPQGTRLLLTLPLENQS